MTKQFLIFSILAFSVGCYAVVPPQPQTIIESKTSTITWDHSNSENISHYEICYGLVSDPNECDPIDIGYVDTYTTPGLTNGDYHFYLLAVTIDSVQSEWVLALTASGAEFITIVTQTRPVMPSPEVN